MKSNQHFSSKAFHLGPIQPHTSPVSTPPSTDVFAREFRAPKSLRMLWLLPVLLALGARVSLATPAISAVSGPISSHGSLTITGSGFATKIPAQPIMWSDFENGIEPSALGRNNKWGQVQSMGASAEGYGGTHGAKAINGSGNWTMRVDYDSFTREGQHWYVFRRQKMNFTITDNSQNWKTFRMWPIGNGYPNLYAATNNGRVFVEDVAGENSGYYGRFNAKSTDWVTEEFIGRASSAPGVKDGLLTMRMNGQDVASGTLLTRSAAAPKYMNWMYAVHGVNANTELWKPGWNDNNRLWADDVYVDDTWARVMVGNAPTFAACSKLDIQVPTQWSDGSIAITPNIDSFAPGAIVYLYVFDKDGNVNANGFAVTVGKASANQAPTPQVPTESRAVSTPLTATAKVNAATSLDGTVDRTQFTNPQAVTISWTKIDGPGNVSIANAASEKTTATFDTIGSYTMRLTATDGTSSQSSDLTMMVGQPENNPPTINVGAGNGIATRSAGLELNPIVTDDGQPTGNTVTSTWKKVSGPGDVTFAPEANGATKATFSENGNYVLRITASDGQLASTADMTVAVFDQLPKTQKEKFKNVFNPAANEHADIQFSLDHFTDVSLQIYDMLGNLVRTLSSSGSPGDNVVPWDGRNESGSIVASGIYNVSIHLGGASLPPTKVVVLK